MTMTRLLAGAASIALTAGAGYAQDNEAYATQNGAGNDLIVDQADGSGNVTGLASVNVLQNGSGNDLDVLQSGDDNRIGSRDRSGTIEVGAVVQTGDGNAASLTQTSDKNVILNLSQTGDVAGAGDENTATLLQQGGNNNSINDVIQDSTGGGANVGQTLTLTQDGANNTLARATQAGDDNTLTILQDGDGNLLFEGAQAGVGNTISAEFEGDRNGRINLSGVAAVAPTGRITQTGDDNDALLDVTANRTAFGIRQVGNGNSVGTITVDGDDNALGVLQEGDDNAVQLGRVFGASNVIGITQLNDDNVAAIDLIGSSDDNVIDIDQLDQFGTGGFASVSIEGTFNGGDANAVRIFQQAAGSATVGINGDRNDVNIDQFNDEVADISIAGANGGEGDNNRLRIQQANGGSFGSSANVIEVSIFGDDNNRTGGFSGDAAAAAGGYLSGPLSFGGLTPGELTQNGGGGNVMTLDVGSASADADGNLFAMAQQGFRNEITGSIQGDANQAVVVQLGSDNVANFVQNGGGNVLGVVQ